MYIADSTQAEITSNYPSEEERIKKIAAEFFSLPRFIEDKKSYMLCAILSVTGS